MIDVGTVYEPCEIKIICIEMVVQIVCRNVKYNVRTSCDDQRIVFIFWFDREKEGRFKSIVTIDCSVASL